MTREEALDFIFQSAWQGMKPGLERIKELMEKLGNPEKDLNFIHIAGTNGKGATAAILASIYKEAGYRPGFFLSPDLGRFNQRIQLSGSEISDDDLCRYTEKLLSAVADMEDPPSEFERTTALSLLYFSEKKANPVIMEVGLGGELDSTNVIPPPLAALICHLGYDHTNILGDSMEDIAQAKAGIIKHGSFCLSYPNEPAAMKVIQDKCKKEGVPLKVADFSKLKFKKHSLDGQFFDWDNLKNLELPLLGRHQAFNAAMALETVNILKDKFPISEAAIRRGLARVVWPARFEILKRDPLFILEGGHNPQAASALADLLKNYLPGKKFVFLMGMMADKKVDEYLNILLPFATRVITVKPNNPRALEASILAEKIEGKGVPAKAASSVEDGVRASLASGEDVLALGSFYMAGTIRSLLLEDSEKMG